MAWDRPDSGCPQSLHLQMPTKRLLPLNSQHTHVALLWFIQIYLNLILWKFSENHSIHFDVECEYFLFFKINSEWVWVESAIFRFVEKKQLPSG